MVWYVGIAFAVLVLGAIVTALPGMGDKTRGEAATLFALLAYCFMIPPSLAALLGFDVTGGPYLTVPYLKAKLTLALDALSGLFVLLVGFVVLLALISSVHYMSGNGARLAAYYPWVLLSLGSMWGVVITDDWFFFLVAWELMTLFSYLLIVFYRERAGVLRAGFKYFIMTHAGTLFIVGAVIGIWVATGSFSFVSTLGGLGHFATSRPAVFHLILFLFLVGFATKAGLFPLGDWVPGAYPAAPSPISAILSGVMAKVGIYGLLRVFVGLVPSTVPKSFPLVWGGILAVFGIASALVGSVAALAENDAKRLLAYSSISQSGYLLTAVGAAVTAMLADPMVASAALLACLFYMVAESCAKALLFLNAGSILKATGKRDLNALRGLVAFMPKSAWGAFVGALSLAALPLTVGFVGKWLILASTFTAGVGRPSPLVGVAMVIFFTSMVGVAYSLKFFGFAYLGKSSLGGVREVPASMWVPQAVLAAVCAIFGIAPKPLMGAIYEAVKATYPMAPEPSSVLGNLPGGVGTLLRAAWVPWAAALAVAIFGLAALFIVRAGGAPRREAEPWYAGVELGLVEAAFPAGGFSRPFHEVASRALYPSVGPLTARAPDALSKIVNVEEWLYLPLIRAFGKFFDFLRRKHSGIPQTYMLWQVFGAIVVIAVLLFLILGR